MFAEIVEVLGWILLSSFKFFFTPFLMAAAGKGLWETILTTSMGACGGVFIFYFLGKALTAWYNLWFSKKKKKSFGRMNRSIIKIKNKFGVFGLAATIGVISVPICSLLMARYFGKQKKSLPVLILSVIVWTLILSIIAYEFKDLIK